MYLLPIYFCISSFILSVFLGNNLGNKASLFFIIMNCFLSFFASAFIFYEVCLLHIDTFIYITPWIKISNVNIYWSFLFDSLSCTMLIIITSISLCANIYSIEYMHYDPNKIRYFTYLSLFTFSMLLLITSNNLLQLFLGWEFVGISSYLLINFWYSRIQANKSSILAVLVNKVGDIFLLYSCFIIQRIYYSLDFNVIFLCINYYDNYINNLFHFIEYDVSYTFLYHKDTLSYIILYKDFVVFWSHILLLDISYTNFISYSNLICFFLFIASICKSAQFGFHFWLAEAMEGPTPVSSLLHAATMVTAGIFLMIRMSFLFSYNSYISIYIIFIGSVTSFFSSLIGVTQNDIKKIVAYSTCSQLGYMFLSTGIFAYHNSIFHLFNHAFFKALLFLSSGYLIHSLSNEQDIRRMGGLIKLLPFGYISLLLGSLSLMGIPYFSGFFSKDMIIENFYSFFVLDLNYINLYPIVFFSQLLGLISVLFTIAYSIKVVFYVFISDYSGFRKYITNFHYSKYYIILPIFILSVLSIISGFFTNDMMIGLGTNFWGNSISIDHISKYDYLINSTNTNYTVLFIEFKKYTYYLIFLFSLYYILFFFIFFSLIYNLFKIKFINRLFIHLNNKILILNKIILSSLLFFLYSFSYEKIYKLIDKQWFDLFFSFSIIYNIRYLMSLFKKRKLNSVYNHIGFIIFVLMLCFLFIVI